MDRAPRRGRTGHGRDRRNGDRRTAARTTGELIGLIAVVRVATAAARGDVLDRALPRVVMPAVRVIHDRAQLDRTGEAGRVGMRYRTPRPRRDAAGVEAVAL